MTERENDFKVTLLKPMSVEQIVRTAQSFDYNPLIPLKYWLRTANTLLKEAEIYEHEGNEQQTYLLLYRHAELVLRDLSSHPDARQKANRPALAQANRDVESSLKKLEVLRPRITRRFERHEQSLRDRNARITPGSDVNVPPFREQSTLHNPNKEVHYVSDPAIINGAEGLAAGDNGDLAIRLAHKELRRRATARKATRQAGISEEVEQERRVAGLWGNWEEALARDDKGINQESLSRQMQNVRLQVEGSVRDSPRNGKFSQPFDSQRFPYHYPAVPEHSAKVAQPASSLHLMGDVSLHSSAFPTPPRPPPKDSKSPVTEILPTRPGKDLNRSYEIPSRSSTSSPTAHDLKPSDFIFRPSAYLENGSPLRTIFLPQNLRHKFLTLARPNTHANLETCGILCGTLISNALFISKLVIPEQKSTSDTCETLNESGLFDYVDGEDLMVLGWIHTHPTQTCFMSSRDLHTHCGYQVMMPESIAIVCAPSKEDWGVFRLTDPPGMKSVLSCTRTGLFHPHSENNLYTDALRPGHVYEAIGLDFEIVDLRSIE